MGQTESNAVEITKLGINGEVILPSSYREAEGLNPGAVLALVRVGNALVLAPIDGEFSSVVGRLESAMQASGVSVEELIAAAEEARGDITLKEFGFRDKERPVHLPLSGLS